MEQESDETEILRERSKYTDEELNEEREKAVRMFQKRVNKGEKSLNIALIGPSGCGKSSFCNSVLASFCVEGWRERAIVGNYGGIGEQITHHLLSFPKNEYLDVDDLYDYNYPTLVDMNGFTDTCDDVVEELLRIVFFGRLPHEERLMDAVKLYRSKGLDGLKEHYSRNYEVLKIDRIIFVSSATSHLPSRLMEAVRKTARKEDRVIPIFGVLTHMDEINKKDSEYLNLEKGFKEGLGLPDNRFLLCTTYCDDYDRLHGKNRLDQRHPELDIPILKFMQQVCDPVFKVIKDKETYRKEDPIPDSTATTENQGSLGHSSAARGDTVQKKSLPFEKIWIRGAVTLVLTCVFVSFLTYDLDVSRVCAEYCSGSDYGTQCSKSLQSLCGKSPSFWTAVGTILFVGVHMGLGVMLDTLETSGFTWNNYN